MSQYHEIIYYLLECAFKTSSSSYENTCAGVTFLIRLQSSKCSVVKETLSQLFKYELGQFLRTAPEECFKKSYDVHTTRLLKYVKLFCNVIPFMPKPLNFHKNNLIYFILLKYKPNNRFQFLLHIFIYLFIYSFIYFCFFTLVILKNYICFSHYSNMKRQIHFDIFTTC